MKLILPHVRNEELDLDSHIETLVKRNFDKETGADYWIRFSKKNKLKASDVDSYESLHHLGFHSWDLFQDGRFSQLVPKFAHELSFFKSASSGTTSPKKITLLPETYLDSSNEWWMYNLQRIGIPLKPRCWGIGTAEFWGKNVEYVISNQQGQFFPIYVESRGAKELLMEIEKLRREGKNQVAYEKLFDRYRPVVEDTANIFKAIRPNMAVAPARVLLDNLPMILSLNNLGEDYLDSLDLIITGGDELTKDMLERLNQKLPHAKILPYLGHFMLGAAFSRSGLNYYSNAAGVLLDVVNNENEQVRYGEHGRIVINFFDTILWRAKDDCGIRVKPQDDLGWDGVSEITRA